MSDARPFKHCVFCLAVHGRIGKELEEIDLDMPGWGYWAKLYQRGRYVAGQYHKTYRCSVCGHIQLVAFDNDKVKEEK